ncbi:MAG: NADH-quinone oxidoreductase subunit C [Candidatus Ratteibacteria bacterium]|jgi:NADH:ubiquinone oxidoreductase subunit C
MNAETLSLRLQESFGTLAEITVTGPRRLICKIASDQLKSVVTRLRKEFHFTHLSTISALDLTDRFEILYHFADSELCLTVRTEISRETPEISTITSIIPGAILYERELQDLFGIKIKDIPDNRPLLLPDDWKEGNYPLRKDWTFQMPLETIPGDDHSEK